MNPNDRLPPPVVAPLVPPVTLVTQSTCRTAAPARRAIHVLVAMIAAFSWATPAHAADSAPPRSVLNPFGQTETTLQALEQNRKRQIEGATNWTTFHNFTFTDRREASGIRFQQRPVADGAKTYKAVHYDHGTGLAVADVDADGRHDLYFVNQIGSNQLWRNLGGGRFEDITASAGVGLTNKVGVGASFADIDNDGLPDLFVTTVRMGNVLFRNLGGGRFEDITVASGLATPKPAHSSGSVFFDFDRDGRLDLFVCNVGVYTRNEKGRDGSYLGRSDAFQGWQFPARDEASVLYRNLGGGKFQDVSKDLGLVHRGWSGDATACDVNEDGFPDLYVLSMSGEDRYYENDGGKRFVEKTATHFPKTPWGAMGVKFFDVNLDGRMDLYVTDMHSDMTGAQIRAGDQDFSQAFDKQKSDPWCSAEWSPAQQQRAAQCIRGNAFYLNQGQGAFLEVSGKMGAETYWPWGISVADFNADGFEDVFVTAGMGYPLRYAANSLLLNDGGQHFLDAEFVVGLEPRPNQGIEKEFFTLECSGEDARHPLCRERTGSWSVIGTTSSRSSVAMDLDGDGDLDLITNEWSDSPRVLTSNRSEQAALHYVEVHLVGNTSNRDALGATVKVRCGPTTYTRYHDGKSGYLSQSALPLYFGLGGATAIDQIEIAWPSGRKQVLSQGIPVNTRFRIVESP